MAVNAQIGTTILEQLGNKFWVMVGGKDAVTVESGIQFGFTKSQQGINKVVITLNPNDTYIMKFWRITPKTCKEIVGVGHVYAENMHHVFTDITGLATPKGGWPDLRAEAANEESQGLSDTGAAVLPLLLPRGRSQGQIASIGQRTPTPRLDHSSAPPLQRSPRLGSSARSESLMDCPKCFANIEEALDSVENAPPGSQDYTMGVRILDRHVNVCLAWTS